MRKKVKDGEKLGWARPESQRIVREAFEAKYGVSNPSQVPEIVAKIKATNAERYGSTSPLGSEEVRAKIAATNEDRYGGPNPMASEEVRIRQRKALWDRYGVDNPGQVPGSKEKARATLQKALGVDYPLQSETVKKKQRDTLQARYGVENASQIDEVRRRARDIRLNVTDEEFRACLETERSPEAIRGALGYSSISSVYKRARELGLSERLERSSSAHQAKWRQILTEMDLEFREEVSIFPDRRWRVDFYIEDYRVGLDVNPSISHSSAGPHPLFRDKLLNYHQDRALAALSKKIQILQIFDWTVESGRGLLGSLSRGEKLCDSQCEVIDLALLHDWNCLASGISSGVILPPSLWWSKKNFAVLDSELQGEEIGKGFIPVYDAGAVTRSVD